MKGFDVKCPVCGHLNEHLNLFETDGWMECEKCLQIAQVKDFQRSIRVPIYDMNNVSIDALKGLGVKVCI